MRKLEILSSFPNRPELISSKGEKRFRLILTFFDKELKYKKLECFVVHDRS